MRPGAPARGEVWLVDLDPTRGHEQTGRRPFVVLSATGFNRGPALLAVVVPITTARRNVPMHVELQPRTDGVRRESYAMCEAIRSVALERLVERWGRVGPSAMREIEDRVRILLDLL